MKLRHAAPLALMGWYPFEIEPTSSELRQNRIEALAVRSSGDNL
jgi:hypothetical protein